MTKDAAYPFATDDLHTEGFWQAKALALNWSSTNRYNLALLSPAYGFERDFDYEGLMPRVDQLYGRHLYVLAVIYLAGVFGGQWFLRERKQVECKNSLILWNLALAVMSIMGAWRTVPEALTMVLDHGLHPSICVST
jgi:hypothetical protein